MYLLDTNTLINYLEASLPAPAMLFMNGVVDEFCNISVISKMEALGHNFTSPAEQQTMETFIAGATLLLINEDIVNKTIAIRKSKKIKLPDAILAATALTHNLTLITRNCKKLLRRNDFPTETVTSYQLLLQHLFCRCHHQFLLRY